MPEEYQQGFEQSKEGVPGINDLNPIMANKGGAILGPDGLLLGMLTHGEKEELVGAVLYEDGKILGNCGVINGWAELIPSKTLQNLKDSARSSANSLLPGLSIVEGNLLGNPEDGKVAHWPAQHSTWQDEGERSRQPHEIQTQDSFMPPLFTPGVNPLNSPTFHCPSPFLLTPPSQRPDAPSLNPA